jgi:hypothetical protein
VAPTLDQDIEDMDVLSHRPPVAMPLALDRQEDLFEMPRVSKPRPALSQLIRVLLPKLLAPLADRFIPRDDATGEQELFYVAVAQTEVEVQPDAMADDFYGRTMMPVIIRTGWCVHEATIAHQTAVVQAAKS